MAALLVALLAGCASGPPPPAWRVEAKSSFDLAVDAYLRGDRRVADAAFERGRREIASSGRLDLLARAELLRCAAAVASTVFEPCAQFERLRADADAADRAYADYLVCRLSPQDARLLPPAHRTLAATGMEGDAGVAALRAIDDPLARLVALGVLFQAGRAPPAAIGLGVDTASEQGWRRALLAWLEVQLAVLEQAGDMAQAGQVRRRIELVSGSDTRRE
ncbi:MAG: hypothetical protein EHM59_01865 [Betaproteobacteria bacterium]|nr:MAG: hypothetical protein EHM59_07730 [Betaproteobacteria bacterium]RPI48163.1 MAG: hypothetical protein EHM59_01865 [Betaproteobacteria bacterium]